ncbi:hypothetical protein B566_EDAN008968 [Ephemera danica]|nr:hypothetical protein B566_EDAN008968 [Ephemera danica]
MPRVLQMMMMMQPLMFLQLLIQHQKGQVKMTKVGAKLSHLPALLKLGTSPQNVNIYLILRKHEKKNKKYQ